MCVKALYDYQAGTLSFLSFFHTFYLSHKCTYFLIVCLTFYVFVYLYFFFFFLMRRIWDLLRTRRHHQWCGDGGRGLVEWLQQRRPTRPVPRQLCRTYLGKYSHGQNMTTHPHPQFIYHNIHSFFFTLFQHCNVVLYVLWCICRAIHYYIRRTQSHTALREYRAQWANPC